MAQTAALPLFPTRGQGNTSLPKPNIDFTLLQTTSICPRGSPPKVPGRVHLVSLWLGRVSLATL